MSKKIEKKKGGVGGKKHGQKKRCQWGGKQQVKKEETTSWGEKDEVNENKALEKGGWKKRNGLLKRIQKKKTAGDGRGQLRGRQKCETGAGKEGHKGKKAWVKRQKTGKAGQLWKLQENNWGGGGRGGAGRRL